MYSSFSSGGASKKTLVIVTTVSDTLKTILQGQPKWLSTDYNVICIKSPSDDVKKISSSEGVLVRSVPMVRGISPIRDLISVIQMFKVLKEIKPDVVHSYTPKAGMVSMFASFFVGVKVRIHTFTGLIFPVYKGWKRTLLITIDKLICVSATHVIPEGLGVSNDLSRHEITKKNLKIIGNGNVAGVDVNFYHPNYSFSLMDFPDGQFVFSFVGRLNRDKGIDELISAFLTLPSDPVLLLIGDIDKTAPISDDIIALISSHPRIHALGFLEDIRSALVSSDVMVLPSYREGFPNVVLQAGAMGKPVIASNVNGCNEIIVDDFNGWLVPARNAAALAECMKKAMWAGSVALCGLGDNARALIVEKFEQEKYRNALLDFYREVLVEKSV
jgi:glycosyltransferase involved in cell wall biosynthesis